MCLQNTREAYGYSQAICTLLKQIKQEYSETVVDKYTKSEKMI